MGREDSASYMAETKYSNAWEDLVQTGYSAKVEKPTVVSFHPPGTSKTLAGPEMLQLSLGR
jgi:hypothetical protein